MVQRKPPKKLGPQPESPESRSSSHHHQDTRTKGGGGGGGDLIRIKMKKPSPPIKASDGSPNYMKPTSSSDARKEALQVPVHSPIATDKNRSPRNSTNLKNSSSPPVESDIKPPRSLTRSSSLKPMRSSMKKSSGMGVYPKKNVSRPTCSSTLKDSNLPTDSNLESEETSVVSVCPYTYCSLGGHKHEPLPPLKSFLSTRRRLVKAQSSMKLKRLSSLIAASSTTPSGLQINPLFEDVGIDFFVGIEQLENCDEGRICEKRDIENSEVLDELSPTSWTVKEMHKSSLDISATFESIDTQSEVEAGSYPDSKTDYTEDLDRGFDPIFGLESSILDDGFDEESDISTDAASVESPEKEETAKTPTITSAEPKAGHSRRRWRQTTVDVGKIREFNPRGPRFLPLEPDLEAEKVDLRHQQADERKNTEEWMIDYALRQTVAKLSSDREKKVELLVEAFETICEAPLAVSSY